MKEKIQILKMAVQDPRCPSYFRLQEGHVVPLNDIRNENPYLDGAIATEIDHGTKLGQGSFDRGILIYKPYYSQDGYGIPPKR